VNGWTKALITLVIKGLPNMLGLLVLAWLLFQIVLELLARNKSLTEALLSCNR
jgi:hypothetical protein